MSSLQVGLAGPKMGLGATGGYKPVFDPRGPVTGRRLSGVPSGGVWILWCLRWGWARAVRPPWFFFKVGWRGWGTGKPQKEVTNNVPSLFVEGP